MSQPDAVSSAICWRVVLTSAVRVVHHRLHRDRVVAADPDLADLDLAGLAAGREHGRGCLGHPQTDGGHGPSVGGRRPDRPLPRVAGQVTLTGTTRSPTISTTPMTSRKLATTYATGRSLATSTYPGSGRRRSRAMPRRIASQRAPAMWPPSSGSSGTKLNRPMKKLKPATRPSRLTSLSLSGKSCADAVSPARRPPPTTLTGLSAARGLTPAIASADAPDLDRQGGQRDGRLLGEPAHLLDRVDRAAGGEGDRPATTPRKPDRGQLGRVVLVGGPRRDQGVGVQGEPAGRRARRRSWPRRSLLLRIRSCMSVQSCTGVPLKDTNRSPACSPACAAGLTGSLGGAHASVLGGRDDAGLDLAHRRCGATSSAGLPYVANSPAKIRNAIIRLTVGPPAITTTFFHQAIR